MGEKLATMKVVIMNHVRSMCIQNDVTPLEATMVLESVTNEFRKMVIDDALMASVTPGEPPKKEEKTGTVEDLMEAFKKTGFKPEEKG